jgi:hypothetical protein
MCKPFGIGKEKEKEKNVKEYYASSNALVSMKNNFYSNKEKE